MTNQRTISPFSQVRRLKGWLVTHPNWVNSLIYITLVVILYELIWQLDFYYQPITQTTLAVALLIAIVTAAFRYGMRPGLMVAAVSNIYGLWAYTGPERGIDTVASFLRGEWTIIILFFGPAIIVGYLSGRVSDLLMRERQARYSAEQEQIRLTTILEQLPVGVVIAEAPSGNILFGNQYLEQLLGHSVMVAEPSQDFQTLANNQTAANVETKVNVQAGSLPLQEWPLKQIISGQALQNEEYSYSHEGHDHVLRVSGTPIYNANQNIAAGVVIIDDITKEKELDQRKDDFVSMVSHELKTPLTSLKMYIQLVSRQLDKTQSADLITTLAKANLQADKLTQLINDMLALSRIQSDKLEYRFEIFDLCSLATEIVEDLQAIYPDQKLELECIESIVSADRYRLGQVLVNLITNAIKYAPESDRIIVKVDSKDEKAILSVKDFGDGIALVEQTRIFERFYQAPNRTGNYPGLGIGLYLSSDIVKHHHGEIWVKSTQGRGKGATFYVSLPLALTIADFSSSARTISKTKRAA